jgi:Ca2+-transporting ATPase
MQNFNLPPYHAKAEDIVNHFHPNSQKDRNKILSKPPGYLPAEFIKIREVHGFNILEGKPKPSLLEKIWDNLMDNQMLLLLLGSAVISAALGQWDDSISILVVIIPIII